MTSIAVKPVQKLSLDAFKKQQRKQAAVPEREKEYAPVVEGDLYEYTRHNRTTLVWVVKVKVKEVVLKRSLDAKDSFTESRTRFDKFYRKVDGTK